jgi:hypothetical protein
MFQDLFGELLAEHGKFLNEYSTFLRIRKRQKVILDILRRDDANSFATLLDEDLEQEILRLFNITTTDIRIIAAALCGAQRCLGSHRGSDATFETAAVWGDCHGIVKTLDPGLSATAIVYHRYDFPLPGDAALASVAIEAENITALQQLAASGVEFTPAHLEEAISKRKLASFMFLIDRTPIAQSAFGLAVRLDEVRMIQAIMRGDLVDINAPVDEDGSTALHIVARLGLLRTAALLLTNPTIDCDVADANGALPWSVARRTGHPEIAGLIQEFRKAAASRGA